MSKCFRPRKILIKGQKSSTSSKTRAWNHTIILSSEDPVHLQPRRLDDSIEEQGPFIQHGPLCTPGMDTAQNRGDKQAPAQPRLFPLHQRRVLHLFVKPASLLRVNFSSARSGTDANCCRDSDPRFQDFNDAYRTVDVHPSNDCIEKTQGAEWNPFCWNQWQKEGSWYKESGESLLWVGGNIVLLVEMFIAFRNWYNRILRRLNALRRCAIENGKRKRIFSVYLFLYLALSSSCHGHFHHPSRSDRTPDDDHNAALKIKLPGYGSTVTSYCLSYLFYLFYLSYLSYLF